MRNLKILVECGRLIAFLSICFVLPGIAKSEELADFLPSEIEYDPSVPKPADVLGYDVGEWHIRHDQLVEYLHILAESSDRFTIEETGRTHEKRPLLIVTVSSPQNHSRIEEIREAHVARLHPDGPDQDDGPAVCYMGYSVHGNESSGSNAVPLLAYYLAAGRGPEIDELLENTVILIDPCLNPDGLSRFAQWANTYRGKHPVADSRNREHNEAWPGGRTNHYWFDLNRDWLLCVHPESIARLRTFHRWKPNVLTDFHEMGSNSTYFFQPGVPSRKNPLTPEMNVQLTKRIASHHARALDEEGVLYYSEESFDDFYYGKGSTYPDINGCIGILFEQASSRGHLRESIHGELSFERTIRNQFLTSLSTLEASVELRPELLKYQREFYEEGWKEGRKASPGGWVFGQASDRKKTAHMVELFLHHDIEVYGLARNLSADGTDYRIGSSFVVPRHQRQGRLLNALMETRTSFPDSIFYDVSTWTLPFAMGVSTSELEKVSSGLIGDRVTATPDVIGQEPAEPAYAYAFAWNEYYAPRALGRLHSIGANVRVATRPFVARTSQGRVEFGFGAIVVPMGVQDSHEEVRAVLSDIAREDGLDVFAIESGWTPEGVDLGSPSLRVLEAPRPLLLVGSGVSSYEAGETWHLLDHRFDLEVTLLDVNRLSSVDLDQYTHLLMVSGGFGQLGDNDVERIEEWVRGGGVLVATRTAVRWVANQEWFELDLSSGTDDGNGSSNSSRIPYARHDQIEDAKRISGAIFEGEIDTTHPLGYGFSDDRIALFRNTRLVLEPSKNPYGTVVQYSDSPLLSGYAKDDGVESLAGSASVVAHRLGRGVVIAMVDNPNFRGFWYGTNKLYLNAVFFGKVIDKTGE